MWWGLWLGCTPVEAPPSEVVVHERRRSQLGQGTILFVAFDAKGDENWAVRVDAGGRADWARRGDPDLRILRAKPSRDGRSVIYAINDPSHLQEVGTIVREPLRGGEVTLTRADGIHHDFVELDGRFAFLEHRYAEHALRVRPLPLASDGIRVVAEGSSGEGILQMDLFDSYPADPWWSCDHMRDQRWLPGTYEWSHSNSLLEAPHDPDAWWLLPRYFDALLQIDRGTGAVQWQLGGRDGTFALGEGAAFQHGHASHAFDDRLLVFDNGDGHASPRQASRVLELQIDPIAGTAERVWEYVEPDGRHVSFLGDARRLPSGNTLVSWGPQGRITELTPEGEIVWELQLDLSIGRIDYVP